jgi:uncharacterized protein YjbI with pentapeptide repeats
MASEEHVARLKHGVANWNAWRSKTAWRKLPDLRGADLISANLNNTNLTDTYLTGAQLINANLTYAGLGNANLTGANLYGAELGNAYLPRAKLVNANLTRANLTRADLTDANLTGANLTYADLRNANLGQAILHGTIFGDVDLTGVIGLETCEHRGPSVIDHHTLQNSGRLPLPFLRGVGFPDTFIDYIPSLFDQAIQYYSCFISYSAKDDEFAKRVHADLQNSGVRCWFAPHEVAPQFRSVR